MVSEPGYLGQAEPSFVDRVGLTADVPAPTMGGSIVSAWFGEGSGLHIRLVGSFELRYKGRLTTIPGSAQRLLAFLALHSHPLRRSFVSGTLWPDESEERSGARLRGALSRLRRAVEGSVEIVGDRLQLAPGSVVDVQLAAAAMDRLTNEGAPPRDLGEWFETLTSELLTDWYDEWVSVEREQFRQLRLHALEALCEGLTSEGRYSLAIRAGLAAVMADPLRESAERALIRAYIEEGNPSEAVHQYQRYRQVAFEELGLAPTPRLEEMVRPYLRRQEG